MKKIYLLSALALILCSTNINIATAESVLEPQWAEFCPPLYENVVFKPQRENSKRDMENNYWALRKAKFEKSIMECKVISKTPEALGACYGRIVNIEKNKTAQRTEAKYEKYTETDQQIRDGGYWWY